jgi:hypothetical protein
LGRLHVLAALKERERDAAIVAEAADRMPVCDLAGMRESLAKVKRRAGSRTEAPAEANPPVTCMEPVRVPGMMAEEAPVRTTRRFS